MLVICSWLWNIIRRVVTMEVIAVRIRVLHLNWTEFYEFSKTNPWLQSDSRIQQLSGMKVFLNSTWVVRGISQVKRYIWMKRNTRSKPSVFLLSVFSVLTQSVCFDLQPWSSLLTLTTFHSDWHLWHVADPQSPRYGCRSKNTLPRRAVFSEICILQNVLTGREKC